MQARQEELRILVVGADFVAAAVKAVTYVLSIILVIGTKKSGRVTSPIQFFFWLLTGLCTGFTFGSVVSSDLLGLSWNALGDALVISEFSVAVFVFALNCFADASPLYQDVKAQRREAIQ